MHRAFPHWETAASATFYSYEITSSLILAQAHKAACYASAWQYLKTQRHNAVRLGYLLSSASPSVAIQWAQMQLHKTTVQCTLPGSRTLCRIGSTTKRQTGPQPTMTVTARLAVQPTGKQHVASWLKGWLPLDHIYSWSEATNALLGCWKGVAKAKAKQLGWQLCSLLPCVTPFLVGTEIAGPSPVNTPFTTSCFCSIPHISALNLEGSILSCFLKNCFSWSSPFTIRATAFDLLGSLSSGHTGSSILFVKSSRESPGSSACTKAAGATLLSVNLQFLLFIWFLPQHTSIKV